MVARESVSVPILDQFGVFRGDLKIALLPSAPTEALVSALIELPIKESRETNTEPIQLLEGHEYRYVFDLTSNTSSLYTDKPEAFQPDSKGSPRGRLRPGLSTGWFSVGVFEGPPFEGGREIGRVALEVRSRKLGYRKHYQWMLRDIASACTDVLMQSFAASAQRFAPTSARDPQGTYQRFAFLNSLIGGEEFNAALQQVIARPHVRWGEESEIRPAAMGLKPGSQLMRMLTGPSPKVQLPSPIAGLSHLPERVTSTRTEVTVDNPANRFVKFALQDWRALVDNTLDVLRSQPASAPVRRGLLESTALRDKLDSILGEELFREVEGLTQFPANDQVLQKREGYRDVLRAYLQFQAAAILSWEAIQDSYMAGQRNVASLYEYWVFIQLAKLVSKFCNKSFDFTGLLQKDGLNIALRQGLQTAVSGTAERFGRRLRLELTYNKTFKRQLDNEGSWTLPMRPDCSLAISSEVGGESDFVPVWLHFDAKYRIDSYQEVFGSDRSEEVAELGVDQESLDEPIGTAKRDDLLKMHSYRDAIKRSAGAYVLYPGSFERDRREWREYHELLPGLGAFAFRPCASENDQPDGIVPLTNFIEAVLDHVATQTTQHERTRYWVKKINVSTSGIVDDVAWAPFLSQPPADTLVCLVPVKNLNVLTWLETNRLLPIPVERATQDPQFDPQVLPATFVLAYMASDTGVALYRVVREPQILFRSVLADRGYVYDEGAVFYCLTIDPIAQGAFSKSVTSASIDALRNRLRPAARADLPVAVTWLDLLISGRSI